MEIIKIKKLHSYKFYEVQQLLTILNCFFNQSNIIAIITFLSQ